MWYGNVPYIARVLRDSTVPVCDQGLTDQDANIICRSMALGLGGAPS